jgi:NAD(P)-dependent dehydrogenase (short-subunit alcohol dehydrogenase family)
MGGKVAVVTGASTGIGREIALGLSWDGYKVLMVSRDPGRAAAALEAVTKGGGEAESIVADLSLVSDARRVAAEVKAKTDALQVLLHCAAVVPSERKVSAEGHKTTFACNTLAPYLLTRELAPLLQPGARVVFFHGGNIQGFTLDDLESAKPPYDGWAAYSRTKHHNVLMTFEYARRLAEKKVLVNGAWPGIVNTEGMRALPGRMKWFGLLMRPLMRTPAQGARMPLWLATSDEVDGITGKVYGTMFGDGRKEVTLIPELKDPKNAEKLFEACEKATG